MKRLLRSPLVNQLLVSAITFAGLGMIEPVGASSSPRQTTRTPGRPSAWKVAAAPVARLAIVNHKNGTSSLTFKFLNVPANFEVEKIELQVKQTKPVSPVQGSPSEQVKAAYYTAEVSNTTFDLKEPLVTADVRLYHNPKEPYALSVVCLWYSRANTHVEFSVKPRYLNSKGQEIAIRTEPQNGIVVLENRLAVSPVDLRAQPAGDSKGPTCSEQNEGK